MMIWWTPRKVPSRCGGPLVPKNWRSSSRRAGASGRGLPGHPIFYPVLNEDYAAKIARDWNVKHSGSGYVTRFRVRRSFLDRYQVHLVGGRTIAEYWIPAEDLAEFNANIIGCIELIAEYQQDEQEHQYFGLWSLALAEIHGNRIAQKAVLADAQSQGAGRLSR